MSRNLGGAGRCTTSSWLTFFVFMLVVVTSARASFRTFKWIEPTDYPSLSGRFVLHVDPDERRGAGGASYTMREHGKVLWQRRHDFTLFSAAVTDGGRVVGYAYSNGPSGRGGPGSFSVVLLDERGEVLCEDEHERHYTTSSSTNPVPEADGVVLNESARRFVVRVSRSAETTELVPSRFTLTDEGGERLWIYDLKTGKRQKVLAAGDILFPNRADSERLRNAQVCGLRAVPGTPLFLLHCDYSEWDEKSESFTTWPNYALIDADGRVVWSTPFRPERKHPNSEMFGSFEPSIGFIDERSEEPPAKERGILTVGAGNFEVILPEENQRVTFGIEASRDEKGETRWSVRETARAEYLPPEAKTPEPLKAAILSCPELPRIRLGGEKGGVTPSDRGVASFAFDGVGKICLLRAKLGQFDLVELPSLALMDQDGQTLHEFDLAEYCDEEGQFVPSNVAWIGGSRFVFFENRFPRDEKARLFIADFEKKALHVEEVEGCQGVEHVASFPDGHFVGVAGMMVSTGLYYFDPTGKLMWSKRQEVGHGLDHELSNPQDVTTNGKDRIVVSQAIPNAIQEFDRAGKFIRIIKLRELWTRKVNYVMDIEFKPGQGYVIGDYHNTPTPIVETDMDGRNIADYAPVFEDGREVSVRGGIQIAPDGSEWTTDGDSVYRLNGKSHKVDRVLGRPVEPAVLADPTNIVCQGLDDTVYVADRRSLAVHGFDADGRRRVVARPRPSDVPPSSVPKYVGVSHEGKVFLRTDAHDRAYIGLSPDGRPDPLPPLPTLREEWDRSRWYFARNADRCWVVDWYGMKLADLSGKTLRNIPRGVNNRWLSIWAVAVGPDGSLVALTYEHASECFGLHSFSAEGEPLTFTKLKGAEYSMARHLTAYPWVAGSPYMHRPAFDGRRVFIALNNEVHVWTLDGEAVGKIVFAGEDVKPRPVQPMITADGRELWLVDGESLVVQRFDLTGIREGASTPTGR